MPRQLMCSDSSILWGEKNATRTRSGSCFGFSYIFSTDSRKRWCLQNTLVKKRFSSDGSCDSAAEDMGLEPAWSQRFHFIWLLWEKNWTHTEPQISGLIRNSICPVKVHLEAYCIGAYSKLLLLQSCHPQGLAGDCCILWPSWDTMVVNGTLTLFVLQNGPWESFDFPPAMVPHLQYLHAPSCRLNTRFKGAVKYRGRSRGVYLHWVARG